ncbi:hypothetical protein ACNKHM_03620 [Shigella sonnei]
MRGQIQDMEPEQIHLAIKEARVLERRRRACRSTAKRSMSEQNAA